MVLTDNMQRYPYPIQADLVRKLYADYNVYFVRFSVFYAALVIRQEMDRNEISRIYFQDTVKVPLWKQAMQMQMGQNAQSKKVVAVYNAVPVPKEAEDRYQYYVYMIP